MALPDTYAVHPCFGCPGKHNLFVRGAYAGTARQSRTVRFVVKMESGFEQHGGMFMHMMLNPNP